MMGSQSKPGIPEGEPTGLDSPAIITCPLPVPSSNCIRSTQFSNMVCNPTATAGVLIAESVKNPAADGPTPHT